LLKLEFSAAELKEIDHFAQEGSIDLWKSAREGEPQGARFEVK
jgi:hypothetical protein